LSLDVIMKKYETPKIREVKELDAVAVAVITKP
jgi:hypothetical protein